MPPIFNWRHGHEARVEAPCRHSWCKQPTFLRDDDGLPSHKVCAERAAETRQAKAAANYRKDTLT